MLQFRKAAKTFFSNQKCIVKWISCIPQLIEQLSVLFTLSRFAQAKLSTWLLLVLS